MVIHSPPKKHSSSEEIGESSEPSTCGMNEPKNDVPKNEVTEVFLIYPSGKLGAMTRKRNQIAALLEAGPIDQSKLGGLRDELLQKISNFEEACDLELMKSGVPDCDVSDFRIWFDQHLQVNRQFGKHISKIIIEGPQDSKKSTVLGGSEPSSFQISCRSKTSNIYSKLSPGNSSEKAGSDLLDPTIAQILLKQNEITELLAQEQIKSCNRFAEPEKFSGEDPLEYKSFILSFERTIEQRTKNKADLYYSLLKYTTGEANQLVKSCNFEDVDLAYSKARNLLDQKYNNEFMIANFYIEKLEKWDPIESEDAVGLNELAVFLTRCSALMCSMSSLNQLNSLKEIRDIVGKFPSDLRKKFRELVGAKMREGEEVKFDHLVQFVNRHAQILQIPLFGDIVEKSKNKERKVFSTTTSKQSEKPACLCCKKNNHFLNDCFFFKRKTLSERESFVRNNKICFGCLKTNSHFSAKCNEKLICTICKKRHPSTLHRGDENADSQSQANEEFCANEVAEVNRDITRVSSHHVKIDQKDSKILYPAVLVDVRITGCENVIRTYLGMDPYCSDTFIDQDLIEKLSPPFEFEELSLTTMQSTDASIKCKKISNIRISSRGHKDEVLIKSAFSKADWPFQLADSPGYRDIENYPTLKRLPFVFEKKKIGIFVGLNYPDILKPLEIVHTTRYGPYATRHLFGWALNGPVISGHANNFSCFHVRINNSDLVNKFESVFAKDFQDVDETPFQSIEDREWLEKVESSIVKLDTNHLQIGLPFRNENVCMPNNYDQARYRLEKLKQRLVKNEDYFVRYNTFMKDMIEHNYAEQIPNDEVQTDRGKVWYLTHFSVEHKQKKKLRIVFDCSLKYQNISLNDELLQGPDLINNLVGVLLRFRQYKFAYSSDIKSMFYQVRVPKEDSNFLRFLWYPENDLSQPPVPFRLLVHVFGAKSSPSCANYALQYIANSSSNMNEDIKSAILKSFYVDDLLKSVKTENEGEFQAKTLIEVLRDSGFELTSFVSNSRKILASLPNENLSSEVKEINLHVDNLPDNKALGVIWNTQNDTFSYRTKFDSKPCTKRGILSTLFSIYDPLFLASPAILTGKRIFQELCELKVGWDDKLDEIMTLRWNKWIDEIHLLSSYEIPRCIASINGENYLHIFCDGSMICYGAVAYLRVVTKDQVKCSIVMAKARLTPLNKSSLKTVPRIELNSAKIAISLYQKIINEIDITIVRTCFWSDSTVVLNYIKSNNGRFHRFVANRIAFIRSVSKPEQWFYVPSELNPADLLSRGFKNISEFVSNNFWKNGPRFLSQQHEWPEQNVSFEISDDDVEVKRSTQAFVSRLPEDNPTAVLMRSTSDWFRLLCRVSSFMRVIQGLRFKSWKRGNITVEELKSAEISIWRYVQQDELQDEFKKIKNNNLGKRHYMAPLCPFIDERNLIRVGGRLRNASIDYDQKHPIILPKKNKIVKMLCLKVHSDIGHLGRESLLAQLRRDYHIIACSTLVKEISRQCLICRKVQGRPCEQIMADLPSDRLTSDLPPFSNTGIDYFGPMLVKRGRVEEKHYGVIFTCLSSRAIHIEIAHSLNVDSFVNALRRFISRRGPVKTLRSDNGTNFVSGNKEIKNAICEWNNEQIDDWCKAKNIVWQFNPPLAPHFGGVWEREIRTIKKVLFALTSEFSNKIKLSSEVLSTLMCEVENILNNRPLTAVTNDPEDLEALTPNTLLRLHSGILFPPGLFSENDIYHRRRWRQVQHMAEVFWHRWRQEYLPLLLNRQKWFKVQRSLQVGDLVLVVDQLLPRNLWCTGRVQKVFRDAQDRVRFANVKVAKYKDRHNLHIGSKVLKRPITKLILLKTQEEIILSK